MLYLNYFWAPKYNTCKLCSAFVPKRSTPHNSASASVQKGKTDNRQKRTNQLFAKIFYASRKDLVQKTIPSNLVNKKYLDDSIGEWRNEGRKEGNFVSFLRESLTRQMGALFVYPAFLSLKKRLKIHRLKPASPLSRTSLFWTNNFAERNEKWILKRRYNNEKKGGEPCVYLKKVKTALILFKIFENFRGNVWRTFAARRRRRKQRRQGCFWFLRCLSWNSFQCGSLKNMFREYF